jgi:hypothetical protein
MTAAQLEGNTMLSEFYYVVRSQTSGEYLVAHPAVDTADGFLLLFAADYDALSYVNAHGSGRGGAVEMISSTALPTTLKRWELQGVGIVQDPLIPQVQFLRIGNSALG